MNYHVTVYTNEMLVEVRIATDPRPGAGYIAARKLRVTPAGSVHFPPATVWINVGFSGDIPLDEVDSIQRWLTEAAKMARLLDIKVTSPPDFTEVVSYEVRQVAGTLILDKIEKPTIYQQQPVEEWQEGAKESYYRCCDKHDDSVAHSSAEEGGSVRFSF